MTMAPEAYASADLSYAITKSSTSDRPPLTFMSLPREIRDTIYNLALYTSSPIIVWNYKCTQVPQSGIPDAACYSYYDKAGYTMDRSIGQAATTSSLSDLTTNLLICTRVISREATEVFYQKNVFCFLDEHNWDPVLSWLQDIGLENRNHVSSLEINVDKPDEVWQRFDGERVQFPCGSTKENTYPRSSYLGVRMRPFKYGLVDNINPAIETIFQLLGQRTSSRQLKIVFILPDQYPGEGSMVEEGDLGPDSCWHSMDLPNLIEKLRTIYLCRSVVLDTPSPLFDVLWKGKCHPSTWHKRNGTTSQITMKNLQNIADHGWEVHYQPLREYDSKWTPGDKSADLPTYTLRRKKLDEPLMGDDPNPYSGLYIQKGSEEEYMEEITGWYQR